MISVWLLVPGLLLASAFLVWGVGILLGSMFPEGDNG